ncbi:putative transcriptional regulator [Prauserella muralis]|nr:putative transcriptional regulator [Prauserella muralis]
MLGPLESDVMEILWRAEEALPVRAVLAQLNAKRAAPLAYTTVMTVLSRLTERGVVRRQRTGRGYVYCAVYGSAAEIAVRQLLDDYGDAAVASFVEQVGGDEQLRSRLRRLVDDP